MPVTITAKKNGPYRVEATDGAEVKVLDAEGKPFDLKGKTAFSLCRCGRGQANAEGTAVRGTALHGAARKLPTES
jgi:hypothetical protein